MAIYNPPGGNRVFFNFSESGYAPPDFLNISFKSVYNSVSDLQAAITVTQLYHDTSYNYVKNCRKIVVGYGVNGIQTLTLPCLFGGIRDLFAYIATASRIVSGFFDLPIEIFGKEFYKENLPASIRSLYSSYLDLPSNLLSVTPIDLPSFVNVIEISNLNASIEGIYFKGFADLSTEFDRFTLKSRSNLAAYVLGLDKRDLAAYIKALQKSDLSAYIFAGFFKLPKNLAAYVTCVAPFDLKAYLQGYALLDLPAFSIVGYQPNDLPAYLYSFKPADLKAYIYGLLVQGAYKDLTVNIQSFFTSDLLGVITTIESVNLPANINATGKYLDLLAYIVPKTIHIKRVLSVSLYEHKDLRATINYNCLKSNYMNLSASLYAINKLDLKAYIIGWFGDKARNLLDLKAYINVSDIRFLNNQPVIANTYEYTTPFVTHTISNVTSRRAYVTFDTHVINSYRSTNILTAYITGILESKDLRSYIVAKPLANFTTVPSWVNPKTFEVTINLNRFEERWYRFVEMMFLTNNNSTYFFFYVPEEDKVYKVDRNRTWKIQVTGFSDDPDNMYNRIKINKKLLFRLENYITFDEALRDLIDRVTLYRSTTLEAYINVYTYPSYDLIAYLSVKKIVRWSSSFRALTKCINRDSCYLSAGIYPELYHGDINLTALIVGKAYEPPDPDNIHFVFKYDDYVLPGSYANMNWTNIQAEDFWKED